MRRPSQASSLTHRLLGRRLSYLPPKLRFPGRYRRGVCQSGPKRNARTIGSVRETRTMLDQVQITRLDDVIPRWQMRDIKVSTSQLRYALRASEEQIQEAIKLKPGQQMTIGLYLAGA